MPHHTSRVTLNTALSPEARLLLRVLLKSLNGRLVPLGLPPLTLEEMRQAVRDVLKEKSVL